MSWHTLPYGTRCASPIRPISSPICADWRTAANTVLGSHSASFGVWRKAVRAIRAMRSPFMCAGRARLISGSQACSMAGKSFGGPALATAWSLPVATDFRAVADIVCYSFQANWRSEKTRPDPLRVKSLTIWG